MQTFSVVGDHQEKMIWVLEVSWASPGVEALQISAQSLHSLERWRMKQSDRPLERIAAHLWCCYARHAVELKKFITHKKHKADVPDHGTRGENTW